MSITAAVGTALSRWTAMFFFVFVFVFVLFFFFFGFVTPEGFTNMVANEDLEKARAYLNQVPWDQWLNVSSKGHKGNPSPQLLGVP